MKKSLLQQLMISAALLLCAMIMNDAQAYTNEVRQSGGSYVWRVNNVDQGTTSSLATAINNCIGTGNREVHILTGGTLSSQINLQPGLTLYGHNNTFNKNHNGYGFHRDGSGQISIYDLTLNNNTNMGIRTSRASDIHIQNVRIYGGSIGIRIDSHPSRPYENNWVYNVHIQDCRVENGSSHGFETYGIDGFEGYGLTARNMGECGVLLNKTVNGTLGTVTAYNCAWGTGYAGLRYANGCSNITTDKLVADRCGRGFFIVKSGPSVNCHLNNAEIRECSGLGIWIENGTNCSVKAGCSESGVSVSGSGSYANVSSSCSGGGGGGGSYVQFRNRGTGLYLDGMGRTANGDAVGQWPNTTHVNSQWEVISVGSGYSQLRNRGTGLFLDGMGRTTNGDDVGQWANTTHQNSHWAIEQYSGNYYRLRNRGTGLYLDGMGRTTSGDAAGQWANTTHVNAQWEMINSGARMAGEEALEEQKTVLFYPNPMNNVLNIRLENDEEPAEAQIFNVSGQLMKSADLTDLNNQLDVKDLPGGMYLIEVKTATAIKRSRLVKQ